VNTKQTYKNASAILHLGILAAFLVCFTSSFAAKGDTKNKKGVVLKFNGFDLKGINNFSLFSKSGFLTSGTLFTTDKNATPGTTNNSVITFQKGNTTFIYPYQHKVTVPLFKTPAPVKQ